MLGLVTLEGGASRPLCLLSGDLYLRSLVGVGVYAS
jgi:hypothetical protein